jgi:hypothetical protein
MNSLIEENRNLEESRRLIKVDAGEGTVASNVLNSERQHPF